MANSPQVIIGLVNPKGPTNVGGVLRAAGCYAADEVRYTGKRWERGARFHTDTQKAGQTIPLKGVEDLLTGLPKGMAVVCVDLIEGATPLPEFQHPAQALYIFGPEDGSIPQEVINKADHVVYVPTIGCMNLAASSNVLLYDRLAKSSNYQKGDALIRSSRDRNNNTKMMGFETEKS